MKEVEPIKNVKGIVELLKTVTRIVPCGEKEAARFEKLRSIFFITLFEKLICTNILKNEETIITFFLKRFWLNENELRFTFRSLEN